MIWIIRHSNAIVLCHFTAQPGAVYLIRLLAVASHLCPPIGRKMQVTGCHYVNHMRNKLCDIQKISTEWDYYLYFLKN